MLIVVDTDCLYSAKTGVRTYVNELVRALEELGAEVLQYKRRPNSLTVRLQDKHRWFLHIGRLLWTQVILPLKLLKLVRRRAVLLSPEYFTPMVCPIPNAVTLHDAVFFERKEDYSKAFRVILDLIALPAIKRAAGILTVSNCAKKQLATSLCISETRISPVYLGTREKAVTNTNDDLKLDYPFFLYVGVLEKRKNLTGAIRAFVKFHVKHPEVHFVIVGQPPKFKGIDDYDNVQHIIQSFALDSHVHLLGFLPNDVLATVYKRANALVFVSLYEGFGLPILEGFQAAIPVITSRHGATGEVAGDCAMLCDPTDDDDISRSMMAVYEDVELRTRLIRCGLSRAQQFSWRSTAIGTYDLLATLLLKKTDEEQPL